MRRSLCDSPFLTGLALVATEDTLPSEDILPPPLPEAPPLVPLVGAPAPRLPTVLPKPRTLAVLFVEAAEVGRVGALLFAALGGGVVLAGGTYRG